MESIEYICYNIPYVNTSSIFTHGNNHILYDNFFFNKEVSKEYLLNFFKSYIDKITIIYDNTSYYNYWRSLYLAIYNVEDFYSLGDDVSKTFFTTFLDVNGKYPLTVSKIDIIIVN